VASPAMDAGFDGEAIMNALDLGRVTQDRELQDVELEQVSVGFTDPWLSLGSGTTPSSRLVIYGFNPQPDPPGKLT
jgi:hypothetical protein